MSCDRELFYIFLSILFILVVATLITEFLKKKKTLPDGQISPTIKNLSDRIFAWWIMAGIMFIAIITNKTGITILFFIISFLALREYITISPVKRGDHRALFWAFFVILPIQYILVAIEWYGLFIIFIPVYAYLFIPIRASLAGDTNRFLERAAKVQWGLMACVFFISHIPALLMLDIPGYKGENSKLLLFLVFVVQISDVFQYVWGKTLGKRKIAPLVSPNKTLEGFIGGILSATLLGTALYWATPFNPVACFFISLIICLMGFAGGLTMSAIKRDRNLKDYGSMIRGHGGMLDRIDSLAFSAPIFFHIIRYWYT